MHIYPSTDKRTAGANIYQLHNNNGGLTNYGRVFLNMLEMRGETIAEEAIAQRRTGRIAGSIAALSLTLAACSTGVQGSDPSTERRPGYNPAIALYAETYAVDLNQTVWDRPETIEAGGLKLQVYGEAGSSGQPVLTDAIKQDVGNSLIIQEGWEAIARVATGTDTFRLRPSEQIKHLFFLFDSVDSLEHSAPNGRYGPFTAAQIGPDGKAVENITFLAPFPFRHFRFHSQLNESILLRQLAVCNNLIDVETVQETQAEAGNPAGQPGAANLKQAVCENLALAVTVKSGKEYVGHLGDDYAYYSLLSRMLHAAGDSGPDVPHALLPQDIFDRLLV